MNIYDAPIARIMVCACAFPASRLPAPNPITLPSYHMTSYARKWAIFTLIHHYMVTGIIGDCILEI